MIPTIPLRLNYILWIEDLLGIFGSAGEQISGIDIGTGASSVYCLLGAKSKGWHMTGTEVDDVSIQYARANIDRNRLCDLINGKMNPTFMTTLQQNIKQKHFQKLRG